MDNSEYNYLKHNYSEEDLKKIKEFNNKYIKDAQELLHFNRNKLLNDEEYSKLNEQERIKKVQSMEKYKNFCREFPIVSKYIIALGLFSTKAFNKYLDWKCNIRPSDNIRNNMINNPRKQELWKNKYIYGIYVKYLYQEKNNHCNLSEINKAYLTTVEALNKETNEFFDLYEKELKNIEETKLKYNEERKENIKKQLKLKLNKEYSS
jgi:hypothetical protein